MLLKSGYHVYCQIEHEAHELEYHYFKVTDYYKAYILAKTFESYMDFNESLTYLEVYDLLILAISSGYFEKLEDVRKRYVQVIKYSEKLLHHPNSRGIILRAQSEIVNIDYWDLNVDGLLPRIDCHVKQATSIDADSAEDIICGYLNLLNRRMVVNLLLEDYRKAQILYKENLLEIERLNKSEYFGYLYMDYAKGLYNSNPDNALFYMLKAQNIFKELGTENRRLLDCSCEVEYLKCLTGYNDSFSELETAAEALRASQYLEIYSKAKLKLAALKMVKSASTVEEISKEVYLSEYALDYPATGRLGLLCKMVKNAFFIYTNEADKSMKLSASERKLINNLGNDYQMVWNHNEKSLKRSIRFLGDTLQTSEYILDARIW